MFAQIIVAILLGVTSGTFTGLIPGIHINLISVMLISLSGVLLSYTSPIALGVFVIAMSVTHTFLDVIPSIFLGAPDSSQVLGVLPGHRLLIKGKGLFAVKLTVIGSYGAVLVSVLLFPVFVLFVKYIYPKVEWLIRYFIVAVVVFMILHDRKKAWAAFVFCISGVLGLIVLNMNGLENPLFPLLSGMFGISTLLYSLGDDAKIPKQSNEEDIIPKKIMAKALCSGCFCGFLTAVTPALGAGMAAAIASQITRKIGDLGFMILAGSISTFNFILSISTFYVLNKARNGSIIALQELISEIAFRELIIVLCSTLIAGSIGVFLCLGISKVFCRVIPAVNYRKLILCIIGFIVSMTLALTGAIGMIVLVASTAVGLIPAIKKTTRTMAMGCLIVPVLGYLFF
jgi:putative membrane protein